MFKKNLRRKYILTLICLTMISLPACSNKVESLRMKGIEELERSQYEEAIKTFDMALEESRGKVFNVQFDIVLYRAEAEYMLGDYDAAMSSIEKLENANGEKEEYKKIRTQIENKLMIREAAKCLDKDEIKKAGELLDKASDAGLSGDRDYIFNYGVYLEKTADWEGAYKLFLDYTGYFPEDKDAKRELEFLKTRVKTTKK